jgi:hypothetical protein
MAGSFDNPIRLDPAQDIIAFHVPEDDDDDPPLDDREWWNSITWHVSGATSTQICPSSSSIGPIDGFEDRFYDFLRLNPLAVPEGSGILYLMSGQSGPSHIQGQHSGWPDDELTDNFGAVEQSRPATAGGQIAGLFANILGRTPEMQDIACRQVNILLWRTSWSLGSPEQAIVVHPDFSNCQFVWDRNGAVYRPVRLELSHPAPDMITVRVIFKQSAEDETS